MAGRGVHEGGAIVGVLEHRVVSRRYQFSRNNQLTDSVGPAIQSIIVQVAS
jgi:hypothetical protein